MPLSREAAEMAAEIQLMDWSDSPYRADRAGHSRERDGRRKTERVLTEQEVETLRLNVVWVTAQCFAYRDPNFDVYEYAAASGVPESLLRTRDGSRNGGIFYGLRWEDSRPAGGTLKYDRPGTYEVDAA